MSYSNNKSERYHALDGLRGIMMMLGIVLHASSFYSLSSPIAFHDESRSQAFDQLSSFIHHFRMPIFFVMAGFFAALLHRRHGPQAMIVNRVKRVLIPLVVSWLILYPLIVASFIIVRSRPGSAWLLNLTEYLRTGSCFVDPKTHLWYLYYNDWSHLWFLYYLVFFYICALLVAPAAKLIPTKLRNRTSRLHRKLLESTWRPLIFALLTVLATFSSGGTVRTTTSFVPDLLSLLGYGVFFGFGWLLFTHREVLTTFQRRAWVLIVAAVLLFLLRPKLVEIALHVLPDAEFVALLLEISIFSLIPWLLIFGLTGIFIRYLSRPTPLIRYISDASYWIYLVHPPVLIWVAWLPFSTPTSALVKFPLLLMISISILFLSYHYGVRNTYVGEFLNGRRYQKPVPNRTAEEKAIALTTT